MARFVLLQFDDDQEAEDYVGTILEENRYDNNVVKVWGVFQKPTKFCECDGSGRKTMTGYTRGKKYGWWIHAKCMKPTKKWSEGRQWFSVLGTNLLPRALRPYPDEMSPTLESPAVLNGLLPREEIHIENP